MEEDGFIRVTYRSAKYRKKKLACKIKQQVIDLSNSLSDNTQKDSSNIISSINEHRRWMLTSKFYIQFCDLLKTAIKSMATSEKSGHDTKHFLENVSIHEIVCYGLGSFSMQSACPQMALLLLIRDLVKCSELFLYDPCFTEQDLKVLRQLNCSVIEINEEGKRKVERRTIFYLPHCGMPLYNSILWANWSPEDLRKIILIGNSLIRFATDTYPSNLSTLQHKFPYVFNVLPAVVECNVPNTFKSECVFNNFVITIFDFTVLQTLSENIWQSTVEPMYSCDDEIILSKQ